MNKYYVVFSDGKYQVYYLVTCDTKSEAVILGFKKLHEERSDVHCPFYYVTEDPLIYRKLKVKSPHILK